MRTLLIVGLLLGGLILLHSAAMADPNPPTGNMQAGPGDGLGDGSMGGFDPAGPLG